MSTQKNQYMLESRFHRQVSTKATRFSSWDKFSLEDLVILSNMSVMEIENFTKKN